MLVVVLVVAGLAFAAAPPQPAVELKGNERPEQVQAAYGKAISDLLPRLDKNEPDAVRTLDVTAHRSARPGAETERLACCQALLAGLKSNAASDTKLRLLRQLQVIGRTEVVPALASLLDDKEASIREGARCALQHNSAPEAAEPLRAALAKAVEPAWRAALASALAARRDAASAPAIARLLDEKDAVAVEVALDVLGNIGGAEAANALAAARSSVPPKLRPIATDAYLKCADRFLKEGKKDEAAAICESLHVPAEPLAVRLAALRGLIAARGEKAMPLAEQILSGKDEAMKAAALAFVQEIPGPDGTAAMRALLPKLPVAARAAIITQLGRRGDPAAKPAILEALKDHDEPIQAAALGALGSLGGAADLPLLLQALMSGSTAAADAARAALSQLPGKDVNNALLDALAKADAKLRVELLRALALRNASEAVPDFVRALGDVDAPVRIEALKALDKLGDEKALPSLIALLTKSQSDGERQAAEKVALSVCSRSKSKDACQQPVLAALGGAAMPARGTLLQALGRLGGDKALAAVRAALDDPNEEVRKAAIRALASWPDPSPMSDLIAIAKSDPKPVNQVLALQGYLGLVDVPDRPAGEKVKLCQEALAVARRPDEKKRVLGILGGVKSVEALRLVLPLTEETAVKKEAEQAAIQIADALGGRVPADLKDAVGKIRAAAKETQPKRPPRRR